MNKTESVNSSDVSNNKGNAADKANSEKQTTKPAAQSDNNTVRSPSAAAANADSYNTRTGGNPRTGSKIPTAAYVAMLASAAVCLSTFRPKSNNNSLKVSVKK